MIIFEYYDGARVSRAFFRFFKNFQPEEYLDIYVRHLGRLILK